MSSIHVRHSKKVTTSEMSYEFTPITDEYCAFKAVNKISTSLNGVVEDKIFDHFGICKTE